MRKSGFKNSRQLPPTRSRIREIKNNKSSCWGRLLNSNARYPSHDHRYTCLLMLVLAENQQIGTALSFENSGSSLFHFYRLTQIRKNCISAAGEIFFD